MIPFFRKVRKKMADDNRPLMYMRYAIGEIVLVVVGILIALQINNWNEDRKDGVQEMVILEQLQAEFRSNLTQLDQKIATKEDLMNSVMRLFYYIDHSNLRNKDSINYHLGRTMPYSTFDPIVNDMVGSGNMRLIKNNELKQLLALWTSEIQDVKEDELNWKDYRNLAYMPFLVRHYQLRTIRTKASNSNVLGKYSIALEYDASDVDYDIGLTIHKEDYNSLLNHPDFEDHMERALGINRFAHAQSFSLRKRIIEILDLLEKEISA